MIAISTNQKRLSLFVLVTSFVVLNGCNGSPFSNGLSLKKKGVESDLTASVKRGEYIANASACISCHTSNSSQLYSGGKDFGIIKSANITPDSETGIGKITLVDFKRAVQQGIRPDGQHLLYQMRPSEVWSVMTEQDISDMYNYFMHGVKPVSNLVSDSSEAKAERDKLKNNPPFPITPPIIDATKSSYWNRGKYLVRIGHCSGCHSQYNSDGTISQEETEKNYLTGSLMEGWSTVNLRGDMGDGLGKWSEQDIVDLLKTGRNSHAAAVGPIMPAYVWLSSQRLNDFDLKSIAVYLKSLSASGTKANYQPNNLTQQQLFTGNDQSEGAKLYLDNCSGCHSTSGLGYANVFPAMAGNILVLNGNPTSLISLILNGSTLPAFNTAPSSLTMPSFSWRLSDSQVAILVNYLRNS